MGAESWRRALRVHPLLIGLSLLVAILLYLLLSAQLEQVFKREQLRTELFWNGYIKMYYEQAGDWSGLEARLHQDRYMRGSDDGLAIHVYERDGETNVATAGSMKGAPSSSTRKIPILMQGETIGYTTVELTMPAKIQSILYGIPLLLAILIYSAGMLHLRRVRSASESTRRAIAFELLQRTSSERGASLLEDVEQEPIELAMGEVDKLAAKVEQLETVRRTMVADIAHELRTPIAIMRTQLDNALHDGEPIPLPKIAALHDETLRLTKLVRDLQELSLAETGHLPLDKGWFSLTELVQSVSEALGVEAEERQLTLKLSHENQDIRVYADKLRVRQIMINLIGNALEHARSTLHIEMSLQGSEAYVQVNDDGWGIEAEEQSRVFDRFYRGRNENRAKTGASGLGLGLAIAYQFALAHNGNIALSSRWGEGASFTLKLPIIDG